MKIPLGLVVVLSTFAGIFGMCYAVLNWVGEPCEKPIFTEGTVTVTIGSDVFAAPILVRTCAPTDTKEGRSNG